MKIPNTIMMTQTEMITINSLNKSAMFTDIHFGKHNNSEMHNYDCLNFIKWFKEETEKDKDVDHIVFLGDWFEHRSAVNGLTLNIAHEAAKILNSINLPIFFIVGNHDLYYRNTREIYTTKIFDSFENFILIDKPIEIKNVLFCPFLSPDEYHILNSTKCDVIYGHFEFKGFVLTGETYKLEHGPDPDLYNSPKKIFSGHFHKRQSSKNVHYIGNTFPMDFGDANDFNRGCAFYDYKNDDIQYKNWKTAPTYIKKNLSEILENPSCLKTNSRVIVKVDTEISFDETNELKKVLEEKLNLREISFQEPPLVLPEISDAEKIIEEKNLSTTNDIINGLLETIEEAEIDNSLLQKIYREL